MTASADSLFSLCNKTILVTGGTRGIGLAVSLRFARAGATVIANYLRDEKSAEQLKAIASEESLSIALCRADLTNDKGLEHLGRSLPEQTPLSGLVHCAATGVHRPIEELTVRHLDWTFNLNVRAFFTLIKLLLTPPTHPGRLYHHGRWHGPGRKGGDRQVQGRRHRDNHARGAHR